MKHDDIWRALDTLAAENGEDWTTLPLEEQDAYYDQAKERDRT